MPAWWFAVDSGAIVIPSPNSVGIWLTILAAVVLSVDKIEKLSATVGPNRFGPEASDAETAKEDPAIRRFLDKDGTGWHVVIRYHTGPERRIDVFAAENEALDWIMAKAQEIDKPPQ